MKPYTKYEIVVPLVEVSRRDEAKKKTRKNSQAHTHIFLFFFKENFHRLSDNTVVSREHMLMALSNISILMVKANFVNMQYLVA